MLDDKLGRLLAGLVPGPDLPNDATFTASPSSDHATGAHHPFTNSPSPKIGCGDYGRRKDLSYLRSRETYLQSAARSSLCELMPIQDKSISAQSIRAGWDGHPAEKSRDLTRPSRVRESGHLEEVQAWATQTENTVQKPLSAVPSLAQPSPQPMKDESSFMKTCWTLVKKLMMYVRSPGQGMMAQVLWGALAVWIIKYLVVLTVCWSPIISHILPWVDVACNATTVSPISIDLQPVVGGQAMTCQWAVTRPIANLFSNGCPVLATDSGVPEASVFRSFHHKFQELDSPITRLLPHRSNLLVAHFGVLRTGKLLLDTDLEMAKEMSTEHKKLGDAIWKGIKCSEQLVHDILFVLESTSPNINHLEMLYRSAYESWAWSESRATLIAFLDDNFLRHLKVLETSLKQLEARALVCQTRLGRIEQALSVVKISQAHNVQIARQRLQSWSLSVSPTERKQLQDLSSVSEVTHRIPYQDLLDCVASIRGLITAMKVEVEHLHSASDRSGGLHLSKSLQLADLQEIGVNINNTISSVSNAVQRGEEQMRRRAEGSMG